VTDFLAFYAIDAGAADLPPAAYKARVVAPVPVYSWTGCYIETYALGACSRTGKTRGGRGDRNQKNNPMQSKLRCTAGFIDQSHS